MIITNIEAGRILDSRLSHLLRMKAPDIMSTHELACREDQKTRTIAKAIIKSVRPVSLKDFEKDPSLLDGHGFKSVNGIKTNLINLYGEGFWSGFVRGDYKITRISIDYSLVSQG